MRLPRLSRAGKPRKPDSQPGPIVEIPPPVEPDKTHPVHPTHPEHPLKKEKK